MKLVFLNTVSDPEIIEFVKIKSISENIVPFKFMTPLDFGIDVHNLFPFKNILKFLRDGIDGDGNTLDFDKAYYEQVFTNNDSFIDLMKIMSVIQDQEYTLILTRYNDDYEIAITDSLMKMIQVRYSINSYIIQNKDDLDENYIKGLNFESLEGHKNFISDCERYEIMMNPDRDLKGFEVI